MEQHKKVPNCDGEKIALNQVECIINEVISTIDKRADSCEAPLDCLTFKPHFNMDISDSENVKEDVCENIKVLKNNDSFNLCPHLSEICPPNLSNLPELSINNSILSTSTQQGEGDYQYQAMRESPSFYQLELDQSMSFFSSNGNRKSLSTSSLITDPSHNEVLEELHNSIYNLSFDNVQVNESADCKVGDNKCFRDHIEIEEYVLGGITPENLFGLTENYVTKNMNDIRENCDEMEDNSQCESNTLQHSQKFCHSNRVQYFPARFDQLSSNFCDVVDASYDNIQLISEENDGTEVILSDSSEELATLEGDMEVVESFKKLPQTNPFKNPFICSTKPSTIVLSPRQLLPIPNTPNSSRSQTNIQETVTDLNAEIKGFDWEEALEVQVKVTEPEHAADELDLEEDESIIQTREYWSNVGLMKENKINPKYLGPLPDILGIDSVQGVMPVKEIYLKKDCDEVLQLNSSDKSTENNVISNHDQNGTELNYLSLPSKSKSKKTKKTFMSRLTNIFKSKSSAKIEDKK